MYERFTDRSRKVMSLANHEAQRFNHEYVGTEHILLGLIKEGAGVAATALKNMNIDLKKVRLEVEKLVQSGPDMITMGKLPQTLRVQKVIEYAIEEAHNLNHDYIGTEHILLGLTCEKGGVAGTVLGNFGVSTESIREEIMNLLGFGLEDQKQTPSDEKKISVIRGIARCAVHGLCGDIDPQDSINQIKEWLTKV